jgi:hypothetical protein
MVKIGKTCSHDETGMLFFFVTLKQRNTFSDQLRRECEVGELWFSTGIHGREKSVKLCT